MTSRSEAGVPQPPGATGSEGVITPGAAEPSPTGLSAVPERRRFPRLPVRSVLYVDLGDGNGGIILNLSEGGLSIHAVASLTEDEVAKMRFQLSSSKEWVESSGQLAWTGESRRLIGLKFVDISDAAREKIQHWLAEEAALGASTHGPEAPSESEIPAFQKGSGIVEPLTARQTVAEAPPIPEPTLSPPVNSAPTNGVLAGPRRRQPFVARPLDEQRQRSNAPHQPPPPPRLAVPPPQQAVKPILSSSGAGTFGQAASRKASPFTRPISPPPLSPPEPDGSRIWFYVVFAVVLVTAALITASYPGNTGLKSLLDPIPTLTDSRSGDTQAAASSAPAITQFQVTDLNGQGREIPFKPNADAPDSTTTHIAHHAVQREAVEFSPVSNSDASVVPNPSNSGSQRQPLSPSVTVDSPFASAANTPAPLPAISAAPKQGKLLRLINPIYPQAAITQGIEGTVKIRATIAPDGAVESLQAISGPNELMDAAMNAVRQWRYEPAMIDGHAVEHLEDISIVFRIPRADH